MKHHVRRGRVALRRALGTLVAVTAVALAASSAAADPGDVGYEGPSYTGGATHITGEKPQSKVWFNDGFWWASMYDPATTDYWIHKLDVATQTWTKTAWRLDDRPGSRADTLWDGTKLYVASHTNSGSGKLWRFSYNASTDAYALDSGFPAKIVEASAGESLSIAKDSTGQLWAAWEQGGKVTINHTTTGDNVWADSNPAIAGLQGFTPNVDGSFPGAASNVSTKDVVGIVAFGGNKVGIMWSNEVHPAFYFAIHNDADADATWQPAEKVRDGAGKVDDHVSIRAHSDGRLFAVTKTTSTNGLVPGIELQTRSIAGAWSTFTVTSAEYNQTRPTLVIDTGASLLHVFTAEEGDGAIYEKTSPIDAPSFTDGKGTAVMLDVVEAGLNDPSTTKQTVNGTTGLAVLGGNSLTSRYWHHYSSLGGAPVNSPPVANGDAYSTPGNTALVVAAPGVLANDTDANGDPLTASKNANPLHGTVTVNANGSFTYTPTTGYVGPDSFKYKASDGTAQSTAATVSITVTSSNAAPVATADSYSTAQNTALNVPAPGVLSNDTDANGDPLTAAKITNPGHGSVTLNADGSFTYTPTTGYTGPDSFTYKASDGTAQSAAATVSITVNAAAAATVNPADDAYVSSSSPGANTGAATTLRVYSAGSFIYTYVKFVVSGTVNSAKLRLFTTQGSPQGGSVFPVTASWQEETVTWNTKPAASGSALGVLGPVTAGQWVELNLSSHVTSPGTYSFLIKDGTNTAAWYSSKEGSNKPQLVLNGGGGGGGNTAPVANGDSYTTPQNTALVVPAPGVLGNDTDANGDSLTAAKTANPSHGTATVNANGSFTYTPTSGYSGPDSFTYKASDGTAQSANATVSITVGGGGGGGSTLNPIDDAYVASTTPGANTGAATTLRVYTAGSFIYTYVKFTVSGAVSSAKLRLFTTQGSPQGGSVFPVTASWQEETVTWNTKPAASGSALGVLGPVTAGQWVELNVSSFVTGPGTYSFLIKDGTNTQAWYSSKEGSNKPQLVIS